MNSPPHTRIALAIIGLTIALVMFGTVSAVRARKLRPQQKIIWIAVILGVMGLVVGWLVFVLPAHWD